MILVLIAAAAIGYLVGGPSGAAVGVLVAVLGFAAVAFAAAGNGSAHPKSEAERAEEERRRELLAMEEGHSHKCREGHWWQHTGPTALWCKIPQWGEDSLISPEDCPICTGREELLIRGPHSHRCTTCRGEWRHAGRCVSNPLWCPWCHPLPDGPSADGADRGAHQHYCPQCFSEWEHLLPLGPPVQSPGTKRSPLHRQLPLFWPLFSPKRRAEPATRKEPCTAPHRAALPGCPGCQRLQVTGPGSAPRTRGPV